VNYPFNNIGDFFGTLWVP